jgi:hypothetical protein
VVRGSSPLTGSTLDQALLQSVTTLCECLSMDLTMGTI